jgi:hypothetical protein
MLRLCRWDKLLGAWKLTTNRGRSGTKVTAAAKGLGNILYVLLRLPLEFVCVADILLAGGLAYVSLTHHRRLPLSRRPSALGVGPCLRFRSERAVRSLVRNALSGVVTVVRAQTGMANTLHGGECCTSEDLQRLVDESDVNTAGSAPRFMKSVRTNVKAKNVAPRSFGTALINIYRLSLEQAWILPLGRVRPRGRDSRSRRTAGQGGFCAVLRRPPRVLRDAQGTHRSTGMSARCRT